MTEPKNPGELAPPGELLDPATERLIAIDRSTAEGQAIDSLSEWPDLDDGLVDCSECLQLIERVRKFHSDSLGDLLAIEPAPTEEPSAEERAHVDELPESFGRFAVRRRLAEGGFGVVFIAFDPVLEREVALKVPRISTLMGELTQERFLREAKAAAALKHPQIATVFESGKVGPVCYIASAYYEGGTLADALERHGAFESKAAARLLASLADAVQFAHSRGILHRDIKPANVFIDAPNRSTEPEASMLRIADFGLAKFLEEETDATQTGALLGTPAYMSPEQAESRLSEITTRSDVYALGAILYELLTGRPPFREKSKLATLEAVRSREPEPPSRLCSSIPRDLEAICLQCLHKSPERRYSSAGELADDLQRLLSGEPVSARPITTAERARRWCQRRPALTIASALLVGAILVGLVSSTILWRRAERSALRAEMKSSQLATAVDNLNSAIDTLFVTIAESPELRGYGAESLRQKLLDHASQYYQLVVAQRPADDELGFDYAETLYHLGRVNQELGDYSDAEVVLREALQELAKWPPSESRDRDAIEWNRHLAQVLDKMGKHDDARAIQLEQIDAAERAQEASTSDGETFLIAQAMLWSDVAGGELIESNLVAARSAAEKAVSIWEETGHAQGSDVASSNTYAFANSLWVMAIAEEESGELTESENNHRRALKLLAPALAAHDDIDLRMLVGRVHKKLGIAFAKQDRLEAARVEYLAALEYFEELQRRHPLVPEYRMEWCSTRYSLSATEYLAGNLDRTLELLTENAAEYALMAETFPDGSSDYLNRAGVGWNLISTVHKEQGNLQAATEAIERSLELYAVVELAKPNWDFNQTLFAESETNLGALLAQADQSDVALEHFERAKSRVLAIVAEQPDHDRARRALHGAHNALAELYFHQNQLDRAADETHSAIELFPDGSTAWESKIRAAQILSKQGELDGAVEALQTFLRQDDLKQKHILAIARTASTILKDQSERGDDPSPVFQQIGMAALERAEAEFPGSSDEFQSLISDDELIQSLKDQVTKG